MRRERIETTQTRLRVGGRGNSHQLVVYLASQDGYQDSILPNSYPAGTAEDALDCA